MQVLGRRKGGAIRGISNAEPPSNIWFIVKRLRRKPASRLLHCRFRNCLWQLTITSLITSSLILDFHQKATRSSPFALQPPLYC
jgi:hypothetical protein